MDFTAKSDGEKACLAVKGYVHMATPAGGAEPVAMASVNTRNEKNDVPGVNLLAISFIVLTI